VTAVLAVAAANAGMGAGDPALTASATTKPSAGPSRSPATPSAAQPAAGDAAAPAPDALAAPPAPVPVAAAPAGPIPAPPEPPQAGCPVPKRPGGKPFVAKPLPAPAVADGDLPAPLPAGPKADNLDAVAGKGIWVTNWPDTKLDIPGIVARTKDAGLRSIWVRTGGSKQGYYGDRVLPELVPAAHAAGLKVVAWDFPFLSDPLLDASRAKAALDTGIDAFSPDVETSAEGTHATAQRVALYLSLVRSYAGVRPVAATVPRPTPLRRKSFPYSAFQDYADLFVPMVYWSCNEPGALVEQSLTELGKWLPVAPAGQAYDMGSEGGRKGLPTRAETWRFLDVAKRGGAVGASLWTIEKVGAGQFDALREYPWDVSAS
jgi:hypothetical protein